MARLTKSSTSQGGIIFYDGPSVFDGQHIVGVALLSSGNSKTGNLVQTMMFRPDRNTNESRADGSDETQCADCEQRPFAFRSTGCGGGCYVSAQMLGTVYKYYAANMYQPVSPERLTEILDGRFIRVGTYGDPAALPVEVWLRMLQNVTVWTGYTRQWRQGVNWPIRETAGEFRRRTAAMKQFCMASVFDPLEYAEAAEAGWRIFRTRAPVLGELPYWGKGKKKGSKGRMIYPPNWYKHQAKDTDYWQKSIQHWPEPGSPEAGPLADLLPGEMLCRATKEWKSLGKKELHCVECKLCSGTSGFGAGKPNPAIRAHGTNVLRFPGIGGLSGLSGSSCQLEQRVQLGCFGPDPKSYY